MNGFDAEVEKLMTDTSFIGFCLKKDEQDIAIWETILLTQPERKEVIAAAKARVLLFAEAIRQGEMEISVKGLSERIDRWEAEQTRLANPVIMDKGEEIPMETGFPTGPRYRLLHRSLTKAAAAILLVSGGWLVYRYAVNKNSGSPFDNTRSIIASRGERKSLRLPDGSQVILDGGSQLILGDNFDERTREVRLSGEAYFDVMHDPNKPFVIHTAAMDVKVMGTAFNVRAYPDENTAVTSLIRGQVEVTLPGDDSSHKVYRLHPMQKIVVGLNGVLQENGAGSDGAGAGNAGAVSGNTTTKIILHIDSLKKNARLNGLQETAWTANRLAFDDESLESIASKLEKWFGINVEFSGKSIRNLPFTGSFENPTLEKVLETLQVTIPVLHYKIENKKKLILY